MYLTLVTRILILLLLSTTTICTQNANKIIERPLDSLKINSTQKSIIFTLDFYQPITTDDSFIGKGTEGEIGIDLGTQVFIYNNFFVGAFLGYFFLDVIDTNLVGDYERSRVFNLSFEVGYELPITKKLYLAASVAPFGYSSYRNFIGKGRIRQQRDRASSMVYKSYISYNVTKNLALFLSYTYRNDKTFIKTASEIQNNFNNIKYHNFGLGVKFFIGNKSII